MFSLVMKNLFLVLVVTVVYCSGIYDAENIRKNIDNSEINNNREYGVDERQSFRKIQGASDYDRNWEAEINIVGIGKDDSEDISRPCTLEDWQCIRKFFADNSKCIPSYGPVPDPLKLERITQYYPFANLTAIQTKFTATGLSNSKVTQFYVNKSTGNLVFAIDFKNLNETSPKAYFRYKRTAKESIVLQDYTTILYSSGTFTAVIPRIPYLRLDLAEVYADIDNAFPPFYIGPAAYNSTDPDVLSAFATFSSDIPTAIREAFLFKSQLYIASYIQTNICDFELKIVSV